MIRDIIDVSLGILAAFVLYTLFGKISAGLLLIFNPFLLVVFYFSLVNGEIFGAVTGTICGLVQDSFSLGVFGVAGLSMTVLGYLTGSISRKINVVPFSRNFVFLLILGSVELLIWMALSVFIFAERLFTGGILLFLQPLMMAFWGSLFFTLMRKMRGGK
jgi:rod shape-determining protein MreD